MVEVVADQIIAEMVLKYDQYDRGILAVIARNNELRASYLAVSETDSAVEASARRQVASRRRQTDEEKAAVKEARDAVKQAAKERADAERNAAKLAADAVKAAEKDKQNAAKATAKEQAAAARAAAARGEAERVAAAAMVAATEREIAAQTRLAEVIDRGVAARAAATRPAANSTIGASVPGRGEASRQTDIMRRTNVSSSAPQEVEAEREINHLALDTFDLRERAKVYKGQELADIERELEFSRRIATYEREGLSEKEAVLRATASIVEFDAVRARQAERIAETEAKQARSRSLSSLERNAGRFGEGLGLGRTGGNAAAIGGVVAAGGIAAGAAAVSEAAKYGQQVSDSAKEFGLSARDLQVYQQAAQRVGVTNEQVSSSFRQLADAISRAKDGDQGLKKIFGADGLNIDIDKIHSVNDALPTLIDRLHKLDDPEARDAIVKRLGIEQLGPVLAQGNEKLRAFGDALGDSILSDDQIARLKDTSTKLDEVSDALKTDVRTTVAGNAKEIENLASSLGKLTGEVIHFLNSHPEQALAIIGALAGGSIGGAVGAVVGGAAGAYEGEKFKRSAADDNTDVAFRKQQYQAAIADLNAARSAQRGQTSSDTIFSVGSLLSLRRSGLATPPPGGGGPVIGVSPDGKPHNAVTQAEAEVSRQRDLYQRAQATARAAAAASKPVAIQPGDPNPRGIKDAFAPKPPKGKSADELEKEAAARQKRFEDERATLNDDLLGSLRELSQGADEQQRLDEATLTNARDRRNTDIDLQAKEKQIDAAKVAELKAANELAYQGRLAVVALARRVALYEQQTAVIQQQHGFERDHLQSQAPFANSSAARRRLALAGLDVDQQAERDEATRTLFDPSASDRDKVLAGTTLKTNQQRFDEKRAAAGKENEGPFQSYLDTLPKTADQVRDAFQQAAVDGVQSLNDRLDKSITKMLHLHGLAGQLIGDFIKIALEHEEASLFGSLTSGLGGGGGFGSLISGLFGAPSIGDFGAITGGRASGGPVEANKTYWVGERGPELLRVGSQPGTVIPNHALNIGDLNPRVAVPARGLTLHQTVNIDASGVNPDGYTQGILGIVRRETGQAIAEGNRQVLNAVPGRVQRKTTLGS